MKSKIETFIGFAIKKRSVVFGCDAIIGYRKKMYLLLCTQSLAPNSRKLLAGSADKLQLQLVEVEDYEILKKRNCKALAICDKSLADAILANL